MGSVGRLIAKILNGPTSRSVVVNVDDEKAVTVKTLAQQGTCQKAPGEGRGVAPCKHHHTFAITGIILHHCSFDDQWSLNRQPLLVLAPAQLELRGSMLS